MKAKKVPFHRKTVEGKKEKRCTNCFVLIERNKYCLLVFFSGIQQQHSHAHEREREREEGSKKTLS
jgi:hypothetical protein